MTRTSLDAQANGRTAATADSPWLVRQARRIPLRAASVDPDRASESRRPRHPFPTAVVLAAGPARTARIARSTAAANRRADRLRNPASIVLARNMLVCLGHSNRRSSLSWPDRAVFATHSGYTPTQNSVKSPMWRCTARRASPVRCSASTTISTTSGQGALRSRTGNRASQRTNRQIRSLT